MEMDNWSRWREEQRLLVANMSSAPTWGQAEEIRDGFLLQSTAPSHTGALSKPVAKLKEKSGSRHWYKAALGSESWVIPHVTCTLHF